MERARRALSSAVILSLLTSLLPAESLAAFRRAPPPAIRLRAASPASAPRLAAPIAAPGAAARIIPPAFTEDRSVPAAGDGVDAAPLGGERDGGAAAPAAAPKRARRSAKSDAAALGAPAARTAEAQARGFDGLEAFDGAPDPDEAVPAVQAAAAPADLAVAPRDLGLAPAARDSAAEFMQGVHTAAAEAFKAEGFTQRDFYAWTRFVRHFTPSLGLRRALTEGADYVYGDRLPPGAAREKLAEIVKDKLAKLSLPDPNHGKDAALAAKLLAQTEQAGPEIAPDESSPFQVPLKDLIPSEESSNLVTTAETLRRMEAAHRAYALRDFMLMEGPPAAIKSAMPRYLASQFKIPYLAVMMHPGIGTFELIGGYRPRETRLASMEEAAALARKGLTARSTDALIEAASRVYGPGVAEEFRRKVRADLAALGEDAQADRRIMTLAHALRFGASSLMWQDGYLTFALRNDIWINFEELNAAPTEVLEFLNEFMRTRRLVVTQKIGAAEVLEPRPGGRFMLWATMNPETDSNRNRLAETLKNRWRLKRFGDLPTAELAEILQRRFGLPDTWAIGLVENFHRSLAMQARTRQMGGEWRDGYSYNFRHLLRVAARWKRFTAGMDAAQLKGKRSLMILAREAYSVYAGPMRKDADKQAAFTMIDLALKVSGNGIPREEVVPRPDRLEDLGDSIRIHDVTLPKGPGGPRVPAVNPDYLADAETWPRLYEYAKALSMGEPILLMGESGAGKTSDLEYLFHRLNVALYYKNLDSDTGIEEVIGGYVASDRKGQYRFQEGMLPRAMEERAGAFLDEFNLNPLVEWMNTVIDDGTLYLPHRIVRGKPYLVAAANPPEPSRYGGRVLLSPAVRSRWQEFWVPRDLSDKRLQNLARHWLDGGMALFGRGGRGFGSWADGVRDLWRRAAPKKKDRPRAEKAELEAPEDVGPSGPPMTLDELFDLKKVPPADRPALRRKVEDVEAELRMIGTAVGRDTSLRFQPGPLWAYAFEINTILYPIEHLLTHTKEELVGVMIHEGSHRASSRAEKGIPLVDRYLGDPERQFLWNAIEDPRINSAAVHRLPGAEHYLHALYDRYVPSQEGKAAAPPAPVDPDLPTPEGDGPAVFDPKVLGLPHVEFMWAAQYYWRHGRKPLRFRSRKVERAFDAARPHLDRIYKHYPRESDPSEKKTLAYAVDTFRQIDEHIYPLYEPLLKQSKKKLANQMRGGSKGKKNGKGKGNQGQSDGQGQGKGQSGGGNPGVSQPTPPQVPQQGKKPGEDKQDGKDKKPGEDKQDGKDKNPGDQPKDGEDGKDKNPGDQPKDGEDGKDKKPGDQPKDGADGKDKKPGDPKDGQDGKDGKPGDKKDGDKRDGKGGGGDQEDGEPKDDRAGGKGKRGDKDDKDRRKGRGAADEDLDEDGDEGDDGAPDDEFDRRAEEKLREFNREAAKRLGGQTSRLQSRKSQAGDGRDGDRGGDQDVKPLTLSDVARTHEEGLLNDEASPYQRVYREVADAAERMVTSLENMFVLNSRPGDIGYFNRGRRLDIGRAMQREGEGSARDDVWTKRVEATKRKYKVTLVVDESGSMLDKRRYALQAIVLLVDALHRLQIDVEVIGFAERAVVHLPYGEPLTPERKEALLAVLDKSVGEGRATHDAEAVKLALDRILLEDGDQRLIIPVTDGDGNGPGSLAAVLRQAEASGVGVIGVGVGAGMEKVKQVYARGVWVPLYAELPEAVRREVERYVTDREQSALEEARGAYGTGLARVHPLAWPLQLPLAAALGALIGRAFFRR